MAGVLLLAGHVLNLGGDPEYGTVLGSLLVLVIHSALNTCAAFVWLGLALLSGSGTTAGQSARVS